MIPIRLPLSEWLPAVTQEYLSPCPGPQKAGTVGSAGVWTQDSHHLKQKATTFYWLGLRRDRNPRWSIGPGLPGECETFSRTGGGDKTPSPKGGWR
jgi:hypothetical protein